MLAASAIGFAAVARVLDVSRVAETLYTAALLATVPIAGAGLALLMLRGASAEARSLVSRCAVVGLLVVFAGRQLPIHAIAWASALATPLVALGRAQMASLAVASPAMEHGAANATIAIVQLLLLVYAGGCIAVLLPTAVGSLRARRRLIVATPLDDAEWMSVLESAGETLGVGRRVRLFIDDAAVVPMTWGLTRPVVVLPPAARAWTREQRLMVLLHEVAHIRAGDWLFNLAGRLVCALYWFHPGAWWVARSLREACELACDDRVIASGVRRSDYAELLVSAADALRPASIPAGAALALSERSGLRGRLVAVLDVGHDVRPLRRGSAAVAAAITLALVSPMCAVQLAPTRDVLTTLMLDARWESRAYAVLGLAQRPDSIAVARSAAERDPSPRVRAWARYALGEQAERPDVRALIH